MREINVVPEEGVSVERFGAYVNAMSVRIDNGDVVITFAIHSEEHEVARSIARVRMSKECARGIMEKLRELVVVAVREPTGIILTQPSGDPS